MQVIKDHGTIFLFLVTVVFLAFGHLITAPLFNPPDMEILQDAHNLTYAPIKLFLHIGFWFSQPTLQMSYLIEYRLFGLNPAGFIAVNLLLHSLNAFLVYMLVNMLFARRRMAALAGLLFAFTVGNYGKALTTISHQEALLLGHLYLLVLYFLIRNDFRHEGRLSSPFFVLGLGIFLLAGLTQASTFSILGCLLAYKLLFFQKRRGRGFFSLDLLTLIAVGILFYVAKEHWGYKEASQVIVDQNREPVYYTWISIKNIFRYLNLMVFPLQPSGLLENANPVVLLVYDIRTYIRVMLTVAIVSYSFFGILFGSSAVRFFIAWTYIMLLPFTHETSSGEWLSINNLYLTSLGFCVILAAGAEGCSSLLRVRRWRRLLPFVIPLGFVILSVGVTYQIDHQNRQRAETPEITELRNQLVEFTRQPPRRRVGG